MSHEEYQQSRSATTGRDKMSFKSCVMAACGLATVEQLRKLNAAFPDIVKEWVDRNNSRDGKISSD